MSDKAIEHATDQCTHIVRSTGQRCKRKPIAGGTVCASPGHGGTLRNVRAAAQFRLSRDAAQQEALKRLKARGASKNDTITEMDRLAAEVIVFKDICRERLTTLLALPDGIRYQGQTGEQLRAEVALYERALDRCNTVLATNVKLGIASRRAEIDAATATLMVTAIRAILNRLDLTSEQKRVAVQVVPEELRAISAAVQE